jgi:ankyrin repeat protein
MLTEEFKNAIKSGDTVQVKRIIDSNNIDVTRCYFLQYAVMNNDYPMVELLINAGVPSTDNVIATGIEFEKNPEIIKLTIRNTDPSDMYIALGVAVYMEKVEYIKLLLDAGANPSSAVSLAISEDKFNMLQFLVNNGATVSDNYSLSRALEKDDLQLVKYLLNHNLCSFQGYLDFSRLINENKVELVELLLNHGFKISDRDFVECLHPESEEIIKVISKYKPDINSVYHLAASRGMLDEQLLMLLCEFELFDLNSRNTNSESALQVAIRYKKYATIVTLIEYGADFSYIRNDRLLKIFNKIKASDKPEQYIVDLKHLLQYSPAQQTWSTTTDSRVCPSCGVMISLNGLCGCN